MDNQYSWTSSQWQKVTQQFVANRLPHAILLVGPDGLGKRGFAQQFVETIFCEKNKSVKDNGGNFSQACGECNGCHLLAAGTHPDFYAAEPEAEGKQVQVAAIREINHFLSLKSQFAPLQIVIISPAEAMNRHSANALLKTLEEPKSDKLIFLISSQPSRLLPTVKSRCQRLDFSLPDGDLVLGWLKTQVTDKDETTLKRLLALAGGAPLLARRYADEGKLDLYQQLLQSFENIGKKHADPIIEAKRWEPAGLAHSVKWLYLWVSSLIHLKSDGQLVDTTVVGNTLIANNTMWREPSLDFLIDKTSSVELYAFLDQLIETSRIVNTSVNTQSTLENLLLQWCRQIK